jgi:glycosyltransferase involved in cell wall biosynthesis
VFVNEFNSTESKFFGSVAVVLPAYNEELTIAGVISSFHEALPDAAIWVINNRSSDQTHAIANTLLKELGCKGGVIQEDAPGKGNAVRRAFLEIDADIFVMADADLTYPADEVLKLIKPVLENRADMVVGDRHSSGCYGAENKRSLHEFGNQLVRRLVNVLFRSRLVDIMSGYRVFSRRFVKNYPILVSGFEIETDMTLHALDKRFRIVEVPIQYKDRPEGSSSKLNTVRDGMKVLFTIGNILRHYRPGLFFGSTSLVVAISGLLMAMPVLNDWFVHQYIFHVPLAILATGVEIVAVLLGAIALILDSLAHQDRRNFEMRLLSASLR